jgi:hypothetical protein
MAGLNARQKPRLSTIIETSPMDNQRLSISWAQGPEDIDILESVKSTVVPSPTDKPIELRTKFDSADGASSSSAQASPV